MRIIETTLYKFNELSDDAKETAVEQSSDINVDYDWYQYTYDDANDASLDITSFDIDRHDIDGRLTDDMMTSINYILDNHGNETATYLLASDYSKKWSKLVEKYSDGVNIDRVDDDKTDDFDVEADEMTDEYQSELLQEYLIMLRKEYEYQTTEEAIIETIEANEYEFNEYGIIQ